MSNLVQRSPEWHAWRREGIGSSDASVIMGCNPWKNIHNLWLEKTGQIDPDFKTNRHMERGIALEPVARNLVCDHLGMKLFPRELEHPQYTFLRASLDAASLDDDVLVEIKCPEKELYETFQDIPEYYVCQVQHQLLVSGIKKGYIASYIERGESCDLRVVEVPRSESYIAELFHKEQAFWTHVQERTPPTDAFIKPDSFVVSSEPEGLFLAEEYARLHNEYERIGNQKEIIKQALISSSKGIKTKWKNVQISYRQRTSLDRRALLEDGIDLRKYEVEGKPYAVIEVK